MWTPSHIPFINTRKQILLLKLLIPFSLLLIIVMVFLSRIESPSEIGRYDTRKRINASMLIKMRSRAMTENRDEFLDIVLKIVKYNTVNLQNRGINEREYFDEVIQADEKKVILGLGNGGEKAVVPKHYEAKANAVMRKEGFNAVLNSMISVTRSLVDPREPRCRSLNYDLDNLPTLSIITVFKNEPYISIIRMLHGIINRTPPNLLVEIILVDDFSSNRDLYEKLERYLATKLSKTKLQFLRLEKSSGLIRARMIGAKFAIGDVLVFLDAHCEVTEYWAEPLLRRIKQDKTVVACPVIDIIDEKTLEYQYPKDYSFLIGGFKWTGHFDWIPISDREKKRKQFNYEPTKSPIMPGIFAIDRQYFWEMGSYDPGMKNLGGENLEMSFRIWQCGGSIEIIPCSRVGHLFRSSYPYPNTPNDQNNNFNRVAEVWLDDYKDLLLKHHDYKATKTANLSLALRKKFRVRKKCRSFRWYLNKVYPEKFRLERHSKYYGQVRNPASHYCLDYWGSKTQNYTLSVYNCTIKFYTAQEYFLSKSGQLRKEASCATVKNNDNVYMVWCDALSHKNNTYFQWDYNNTTMQLSNRGTQKCLAIVLKNTTSVEPVDEDVKYAVMLQKCSVRAVNQKWYFRSFERTLERSTQKNRSTHSKGKTRPVKKIIRGKK